MRIGALGAAGVAAGAVYTAGWIVADLAVHEVDATRNTINDLGAAPVENSWLWNVPRAASGVLLVAVALGLWRRLQPMRGTRWGVALLGALGGANVLALVFHRDCLTTDPSCDHDRDYSWAHVGHELLGPFGSVGLVVAIVLLARSFRDEPELRFPWRGSVATLAVFVAALALFVVLRGDDGIGVVQRVSATAVCAWLAAVAVALDVRPRGGACVETTQTRPAHARRRRLRRGARGA